MKTLQFLLLKSWIYKEGWENEPGCVLGRQGVPETDRQQFRNKKKCSIQSKIPSPPKLTEHWEWKQAIDADFTLSCANCALSVCHTLLCDCDTGISWLVEESQRTLPPSVFTELYPRLKNLIEWTSAWPNTWSRMFSRVPKSVLPFHLIPGMETINPCYPVVVHQADKSWEITILEKLTLELIGSLKVLRSLYSWDVPLREHKLGNCCS